MRNLSWNKTIITLFCLFTFLLISSCKKEEKVNIDICLNTFGNSVMVTADFETNDFCKRSIVYRSTDNKSYEVVSEIKLTDVKNKQGVFMDTSLVFDGDYYYKVSYGSSLSQAIMINFRRGNNPIRIFPNPFVRYLTIEYNPTCMPYDVQIFDMVGRLVFSENQISTPTKQLDLAALPNGAYIIKCSLGAKVLTYRIIKQ